MTSSPAASLPVSASSASVSNRVYFIEHGGQRVLFLNYSGCNGAILKMAAGEGNRVISREPPNSVLKMTDVSGTSFDKESVTAMKAMVADNTSYEKLAA